MNITSKQPELQTSIFTVMNVLANRHQAINLSQGFPDFDCDARLVERVHHYMKMGYNQYAPMPGVEALRRAISQKIERLYGARYDQQDEITITAGATHALYAAITASVHPGDRVLIFEPAYDAYLPVTRYSGGIPLFVTAKHPDYHIDWDEVGRHFDQPVRLVIINTPHNPTGAVWSAEDMRALDTLVRGTDTLIVSDEVYEHILFDGARHESAARFPGLAKRSFVISSFGKTYHTTGWKIGYCAAPRELTAEFRKLHQFITYAVNTPVQYAYADVVNDDATFRDLSPFYQKKRDLFLKLLQGSRFRPLSCRGTYFQLLDYSAVSDRPEMDFAGWLIEEFGVAAVPVSAFYHEKEDHHVLRFCFAKKDETLKQAAERLCRI